MDLTVENGAELIAFARENIEHYLRTGDQMPVSAEFREKYQDKGGAFVTLNEYNVGGNPLRGCIGYILPHYALWDTIHRVSISAAVEDPRFPKVKSDEMDAIVIEISVLSVPEKIVVSTPEDYFQAIKIGRDGLIVTQGQHRGLLLPQVPVEHGRNWDVKTFLAQTCQKAWLRDDAWKNLKSTIVEKFTATIFEEETPRGPVREKAIGE